MSYRAVAAATIAFGINALTLLGPRRRTVVDRLAGTVVVRTALYATAARQTVEAGRKVSTVACQLRLKTNPVVPVEP